MLIKNFNKRINMVLKRGYLIHVELMLFVIVNFTNFRGYITDFLRKMSVQSYNEDEYRHQDTNPPRSGMMSHYRQFNYVAKDLCIS